VQKRSTRPADRRDDVRMQDGASPDGVIPDAVIRFGVSLGRLTEPGSSVPEAAKAAEAAGFDLLTIPDHVGAPGPLVALAAAAAVTTRIRLRSYVLDYGFWNAGLLARDVATLDSISAGRVDLGLGLGHKPSEHVAVGLPFPGYRDRLQQLPLFLAQLRRHLDDEALSPRPVQRPVPILIAAMSAAGLDLAAEQADLVALSGLLKAPGPAGTFVLASAAQTDERVTRVQAVRQRVGLPLTGLDALLQQVVVDRDPERTAAEFAAQGDGRIGVTDLLDSPFVLYAASPQDAAAELLRRSRRWGITSWCTHAPSGAALAQVIEPVRHALAGR
jgi:probable F420-dependent oxidoreductase